MSMLELLIVGLWTGAFAATFAIVFSAPLQAVVPSFCAGFFARITRDWLAHFGVSQTLATLAASAAVVIVVTVTLIRRPGFSPIVMLSGLVPLGAAKAFFTAIIGFLKISTLKGEALAVAPVSLLSNLSILFKTTLAIALGAALGVVIIQSLKSAREMITGAAPDADSI
jgi:uncharacterized membrane protein YjjB (DUF3815 family)